MSPMKCPDLLLCVGLSLVLLGCGKSEPTVSKDTPVAEPKVQTTDVVVGTGTVAAIGDTAFVQYKGTLASDGTVFDENGGDKPPFPFAIGQGQVIRGWDLGVAGMMVGGTRKLHIPWQLAYGAQGSPPKIPANADLDFQVKLLGLVKVGEELVVDQVDVKPGSGSRAVKDGDTVTVNYTGAYLNGAKFVDSKEKGKPFTFTLGKLQTISGMEAGVKGMKVGGVRKITVPPQASGGAGGQTTTQVVVLEVELISIK